MIDVVDAHHHLWVLGTPGQHYAWLEDAPVERFHGPDAPLRTDYELDDFRADADGLRAIGMRLVGSVHVDAGASDGVAEARWISQLRESEGMPQAVVAGADLLAADAEERLRALTDIPGVVGVRHILNWHPDPRFTYTARGDIISDPVWLANFAALVQAGLSFDAQVYPDQYADLARLARQHPEAQIILNHTGMPIGRSDDEIAHWRVQLRALAAEPNVSIKISGLGMVDHRWDAASLRPFAREAIEAFGAERAMFASNFPVDKLYSSYAQLYTAFDELTRDASASERAALFGLTARRIYRMGPLGPSRQETTR